MKHQRLHLPLGPGLDGREIGREDPRPAGGQRARVVGAGATRRRAVRGHRHDTVGQARHPTEEPDDLRIGALGDLAIAGQQILGPREEEAGIGAQDLEERGEIPGEAGGAHDPFHFGADLLDLGEPDVVNLLGCETRGRRLGDQIGIPGLSVGQGTGRQRLAAAGDVLDRDEVAQPPERRQRLRLEELRGLESQRFAPVRGNRVGHPLEGAEEGARRRILDEDRISLGGHVAKRDLRRCHASTEPFLHRGDRLLDEHGGPAQTAQNGLVVRRGPGRHLLAEGLRYALVDAVQLGQRQQLPRKSAPRVLRLGLAPEEIVVERVLGRELRSIDRRERPGRQFEIGLATGDRRRRPVGPSIVLAGGADFRGELRELVEQIVPMKLEEPMQARGVRSLARLGDQALDAGAEGVRGSAERRPRSPEQHHEGSEAAHRPDARRQDHELPRRVGGDHTLRCRKSVTFGLRFRPRAP